MSKETKVGMVGPYVRGLLGARQEKGLSCEGPGEVWFWFITSL